MFRCLIPRVLIPREVEMNDYKRLFDGSILKLFGSSLRFALAEPGLAWFLFRMFWRQRKTTRLRAEWEKRGIHVPPIVITSVTNTCNLHCKGCYNQALHRDTKSEIGIEKLRQIVSESLELGVSIFMLVGGEPMTRPEILDVTKDFPNMIFPMFTNGLLIDDSAIEKFSRQKNMIPIISLEGHAGQTDQRRGFGVYSHLLKTMKKMKRKGFVWGISLTATSQNFDTVTSDKYIKELTNLGAKVFFFVEYVPVSDDMIDLAPSDVQRVSLQKLTKTFQRRFPGLFIAFPGDEERYGGCLAAGRGFVHINAKGSLEPCPFAPYSDTSLNNLTLKEALRSDFLKTIRENHSRLAETKGGCALWANRVWVETILDKNSLSGKQPKKELAGTKS